MIEIKNNNWEIQTLDFDLIAEIEENKLECFYFETSNKILYMALYYLN